MGAARADHPNLLTRWRNVQFRQLLILIVVWLLLVPAPMTHGVLSLVFQFVFLNALIVATSEVHRHRRVLRATVLGLWLLGTLLKVVHIANAGAQADRSILVSVATLDALLLAGCVVVVLRFVLATRQVDTERIFASIVAYLLMAIAFASTYDLLIMLQPHSFSFPGQGVSNGVEHQNMLYFSFVTITTLGYGDVTANLPLARMVAVMEAVVGQFYVAVVIAWLVSAYVAQRQTGD